MKTNKMILNAIFIAIGAILHQVTPALGLPMQPDFALVALFIILMINKDYKTAAISGIIIGIFTALTTKFPGGQLPNIIDKVITASIMYVFISIMRKRFNINLIMLVVLPIGTLISGTIFLTSASMIVGLPAAFTSLFMVAVVPAVVINTAVGYIIFKVVLSAMKVTKKEGLYL